MHPPHTGEQSKVQSLLDPTTHICHLSRVGQYEPGGTELQGSSAMELVERKVSAEHENLPCLPSECYCGTLTGQRCIVCFTLHSYGMWDVLIHLTSLKSSRSQWRESQLLIKDFQAVDNLCTYTNPWNELSWVMTLLSGGRMLNFFGNRLGRHWDFWTLTRSSLLLVCTVPFLSHNTIFGRKPKKFLHVSDTIFNGRCLYEKLQTLFPFKDISMWG